MPARPGHPGRQDDRKTCAGTWITGTGKDGHPHQTYLYHVVDNEWSMEEYGSQAVVWQTAVNPVVALELVAAGTWSGAGVLGPEAFDAVPFLDLLTAYGSPWGPPRRLSCSVSGCGEGVGDHAQPLAQQGLTDDQRRQEADHVAVGASGQRDHALRVR